MIVKTDYETKCINENEWRESWKDLIYDYEFLLIQVKDNLRKAPEGRLLIRYSHGVPQYYQVVGTEHRYIPKTEMDLVYQLAQKSYEEKVVSALQKASDKNRTLFGKWRESDLPSIYEKLTSDRKELVKPIAFSIQDYSKEWSSITFEGNSFSDKETCYFSKNGLRVRSKSEVTIVDHLDEAEVEYRYEYPLFLDGIGKIYPDFTLINKRTGQEFIWEHFGKMDDWRYANKMVKRVEAYHQNGYFEGKNLIYTLESAKCPFGPQEARRIIVQYLL